MSAKPTNTAGLYLLMKRGLYYRPDAMGYTGIKDHAGRYTREVAESHADPVSGVTMILEAEADEFSPSCYDDLARDHLLTRAQAAEARADRLADGITAAMLILTPEPGDKSLTEREKTARQLLAALQDQPK